MKEFNNTMSRQYEPKISALHRDKNYTLKNKL